MNLYDIYQAAVVAAEVEISEEYFTSYIIDNYFDAHINPDASGKMLACYIREEELKARGFGNPITMEARALKAINLPE